MVDVVRCMKQGKVVNGRAPGRCVLRRGVELLRLQLLVKDVVPVSAKRMVITETIIRQRIAPVNVYRISCHDMAGLRPELSICPAYRIMSFQISNYPFDE